MHAVLVVGLLGSYNVADAALSQVNSSSAFDLNREGLGAYNRGDYDSAAILFRQALSAEPGNAVIAQNLQRALAAQSAHRAVSPSSLVPHSVPPSDLGFSANRMRIRGKTHAECVRDKGKDLNEKLARECRSPFGQCLVRHGVSTSLASCATGALFHALNHKPGPAAVSKAVLGITFVCGVQISSAAEVCSEGWTDCADEPLRAYKSAVGLCPK